MCSYKEVPVPAYIRSRAPLWTQNKISLYSDLPKKITHAHIVFEVAELSAWNFVTFEADILNLRSIGHL